MTRAPSSRDGFTFLEIIVAVAITSIVAATVMVTLGGSGDRRRVDESAQILRDLTRIIDRFDSGTQGGTVVNGRHPRSLYQLNNLITSTQTANCALCRNSCDVAFTSGANSNVSGWTAAGPFLQGREITVGTGFRIPIGLVRDSLIRTGTASNQGLTWGILQIRIDAVDYVDAVDLKLITDALPTDSSKGVVRWTTYTTATNKGVIPSIFWTFPVAGC